MFVRPLGHEAYSFVRTLAVIGASYLQLPLVEKAKEMGLRVICFAWAEGAVCADISDKFYPISIVEKERILQVCQAERIDGICTIASDVAAPTVAFVAQEMHLKGNDYLAAMRANNKYQMRKAFSKAQILCPRFAKISSLVEADFSSWLFPLIVKPCDRSGSLGVSLVRNAEELNDGIKHALDCSFKQEAIVEEYIEGREISVEFISFNGRHYPLAITDKVTTGSPHFVELEHHQPAGLSSLQYEIINAETKRALDALGITEGASHTEYRINGNDDIYIIELGARMGGDFIGSDLVRLSTGYDFLKGVIEVALGEFKKPVFSKRAFSGVYFLSKETERLLPFFEHPTSVPGIIRSELMNRDLKYVHCSAERSGYIIYQSDKRVII